MDVINKIKRCIANVMSDSNNKVINISGNKSNITIQNNRVFVNGEELTLDENHRNFTIVVDGNVDTISTISSDIYVQGEVANKVATTSGDVLVGGNVDTVSTTSGDISAAFILNAKSVSGDIKV